MNEFEREDATITRLLAAAQAPADPTVLVRARARIAATADVPRVFSWLGSPAALAAACGVLVVSAGLSFAVLSADNASSTSTRDTTLVAALIGDDGSYGLPTSTGTTTTDAGAVDSGRVTR